MSTQNKSTKSSNSKTYKLEALMKAIKICVVEKQSEKSTAEAFSLPRSTLQRYVKNAKKEFGDMLAIEDGHLLDFVRRCSERVPSTQVFSTAQENDLVVYILKCANHYYGLSITELRELAYQFATKLEVEFPENWNKEKKAGMEWYKKFMRRHPTLCLRSPEQTSLNRVKAFCQTNVQMFFEKLGALLDEHHFPAWRIFNMDESGFSTVPTKIGKVIAMKGMRRVGKVEGAERGSMITMALAVDASGNSLPPFFLFPRKRMQTFFLDFVSEGSTGFANESGWMDQSEFVHYMQHFIKFAQPTQDAPVLLLLDNHCSHLSIEALDIAVQNFVHILSFPPHCSHRLQPLDVSVFGPVKTFYKSQCAAWQKNHANRALEIRHLAGIVCQALDLALTPKVIKSGFRATGIVPLNPNIFSEVDYVRAVEGSDTSPSSCACSTSVGNRSILEHVGPLQGIDPKKPSNRGRKPMQSSILTSSAVVNALKNKAADREAKKAAKPTSNKRARKTPAKTSAKRVKRTQRKTRPDRTEPESLPPDDDMDFCIVCFELLPLKLTTSNSIKCLKCDRPVHLKCAKMKGNYQCIHCEDAKE